MCLYNTKLLRFLFVLYCLFKKRSLVPFVCFDTIYFDDYHAKNQLTSYYRHLFQFWLDGFRPVSCPMPVRTKRYTLPSSWTDIALLRVLLTVGMGSGTRPPSGPSCTSLPVKRSPWRTRRVRRISSTATSTPRSLEPSSKPTDMLRLHCSNQLCVSVCPPLM